jgi:predicted small secreted protein
VFSGSEVDDGSSATPLVPDIALASLATLSCNTGIGVPIGTDVVVTSSAAQPPLNTMQYYLVGHSSPVAGSKPALGKGANNNTRISPLTCP